MIQTIQSVLMVFLSGLYASLLVLLFLPRRPPKSPPAATPWTPLSILIPAYNEERNIAETLASVIAAAYPAEREVIVVDDGSRDRTVEIVKQFQERTPITLLETKRLGKARALNAALPMTTHEVLVVLDADTVLAPDALVSLVPHFSSPKVAAVAANVRSAVTGRLLTWFQSLDYALFSAWRTAQNKINAVCVVPQFCGLRRSALVKIGGIPADTATEDFDVCFELVRAGYQVVMEEKALATTKVPETIAGLFRQRVRWARGILQVLRKHRVLFRGRSHLTLGLIAMPTLVYWYSHALLYLPTTLYQIGHDYWFYFVTRDQSFSFEVVKFALGWLTLFGVSRMVFQLVIGLITPTPFILLILVVCFLSYGLTLLSLLRYGGKITARKIIALLCFFPYCLLNLTALCVGLFKEITTLLRRDAAACHVRWEKSL